MPRQDDSFDEAKDKLHKQFESSSQSHFEKPRPDAVELDEGAVHGPGGDSRPDLISPDTAQFRDATFDPELATTRENLPPVTQVERPENFKDADESLQPVAEIMDSDREHGGETGGMGRKEVPKDKDASQGTWHDDPDAVTDNVPS